MSKGQKPRTPRYFPRMKVRGARRKRLRTMYLFQRIGDAANVTATQLNIFGQRLIDTQDAINRIHAHQNLIEQRYYGPVTPEQLDQLGASIMGEDHGDG